MLKLRKMVIKHFTKLSILFAFLFLLVLILPVFANPPVNCVAPTTANPGSDPKCNEIGTGTSCLSYCGASTPGFTSSASGTGIAVVYYGGSTFSVAGSTINNQQVCSGSTCSGVVYDNSFVVGSNQNIALTVKSSSLNGIGWRSPNSSGQCGEAIPATDTELPEYGLTSIAPVRALVPSGYTIVSEQCWGDEPVGDSDFDFNDMMYIVAVRNTTPTATATPIVSIIPITSLSSDPLNALLIGVLLVSSGVGIYKISSLLRENKV